MSMNVLVVALWAVLGLGTLTLAVYRHYLSVHSENDVLHLGAGEEAEIPGQVLLAQKMDMIDRWGKMLTVVTIAVGLAMAVGYIVQTM